MKAGVATFAATDGLVEHRRGGNAETGLEGLGLRGVIDLFAMRAQHADEPLREDRFE